MKAVLQRVSQASVTIDNEVVAQINTGFLVLLGITSQDTQEDIEWLTNKIKGMRIFSDDNDAMTVSYTHLTLPTKA